MGDKEASKEESLQKTVQHLEVELASLRASENAPYRAILADMSDCIVRWETGGIRTFVNDAYCRLFNLPREELIGTSFWTLITPEDRAHVEARINTLTPEQPVITGRHRATAPGERIIWMEWCDRAIFDADGTLVEYQSVGRDITDRVRVQEQKQEIEVSEAITRHSFELAHDLNNIFTIILGHLEILKVDSAVDLSALEKGINKGLELLNQMRDMRHGYLWKPQDIDLGNHIRDNMALLHEMAGATPISLELGDDTCKIRGDALQLDQLLWNLIRNADEASLGQGAIHVSVFKKQPDTLIKGHRWASNPPPSCCVLQISDEGDGIPDALQHVLFGPHISTKPNGQGLGLRTVKTIVDAHSGSISYTTSATGTTFEVAFPAQ